MSVPLEIEIAGLSLVISSDDCSFLSQIADRYEGFIKPPGSRAELSYFFSMTTDENLAAGSETVPEIAKGKTGYRILRRDFEIDVFPASSEITGIVARNIYSFDSLLRVFFSVALLELDGLLLHSSSVLDGSKAFVFFGVSGSGKTTTAQLSSPTHPVLSDELTIIRLHDDGHRAYGTPFWGEMQKNGINTSGKITALFQLVKNTEAKLVPLRPMPALQRILPCVLFFARQENFVQRAVDICCRLVQDLPVYEMHFLPDPSFWRLLADVK